MTISGAKSADKKNNIAISIASSDFYAKYAAVTLQSIINNVSSHKNYDIIITTKDMTEYNVEKLCSMAQSCENVSIKVVNVGDAHKKYFKITDKRFGGETLTRLFLAELLPDYDKIITLDSDMIINSDISEIFEYDLNDYYMAAVQDMFVHYIYYSKTGDGGYITKAIDTFLELESPDEYHNAGLMVLNLKKIRENFSTSEFCEYIVKNKCKYLEQDCFNHFFRNKVLKLDLAWNWLIDSTHLMDAYKQYLPTNDLMARLYLEAEKDIKVYHYASSIKPWANSGVYYSEIWWNVARKTPFFNYILNNANSFSETEDAKNGRRILFVCETYYQLINVINIKYHYFKGYYSDLIITDSSDLSKYYKQIKELELFDNVYASNYKVSRDILIIDKMNFEEISKHPETYEHMVKLHDVYDDIFISVISSPFSKMIYYYLVNKGTVPAVHIFEDGLGSYIESIEEGLARDPRIKHYLYSQEKQIASNISNIYLYKPALCMYNIKNIVPIPVIDPTENEFVTILKNVFGIGDIPKEKYIFFNECFYEELRASNEIEILDMISDWIGKENIIVKVHPRSKLSDKLYKINGYKIFNENDIPWEIYMLNAAIEGKVMMTISSAAPVTPYLAFNRFIYAIFLDKIMCISQRAHASNPRFQSLKKELQRMINKQQNMFFSPNSTTELQHIINYIEGDKR